jgi:serine/threonine protein kinase
MPRNPPCNNASQDNDTRPSGSVPQQVNYRGGKQYKFKHQIGEGAVGKVFQVIHLETSELFAIKRINKQQAEKVSDKTTIL